LFGEFPKNGGLLAYGPNGHRRYDLPEAAGEVVPLAGEQPDAAISALRH